MFSSGAATPGDDDQMRTAESDVLPNSLPFQQIDRYHTLGRMGHAPAKHAPAITNVLAVSFLEFMQCRLRRSGVTATCKTVARRDCAPHTVMRAGRPRTRHARGSIVLHFAIVGGCPSLLLPLALCPSRIPSPLPPLPVRAQRRCVPPRCRPTFNVQRSTFNPSRLIPSPLPSLPVRTQRRCVPPRCRPTFNVQRSTFNPSRPSPLASRLARDCATKPSMDRKPLSPRSAVRRPPM